MKAAASIEERDAKISKAKEALISGVRSVKSGDDWKEMLTRMATAGKLSPARLSFNNQILVWVQAPTAARVATYNAWQKYGRQVRKGEKSIMIMAPRPFKKTDAAGKEKGGIFFRALAVFAEDQTDVVDASKLPAEAILPRIENVDTFTRTVDDLRVFALTLDDVTAISLRERDPLDGHGGAEGWCNVKTGEIVVIKTNRTAAEQFATLVHEVAHACMHKWGEHHTRSTAEVEAESVAFIVCHALGLDTGSASFPYVATWAGSSEDPVKAVMASGKRISDAAQKILTCIMNETNQGESQDLAAE